MSCKHCRAKDEPNVDMELSLFEKMLGFIKYNRDKENRFQLAISGGEPLLHNNFCEILSLSYNSGIDSVVVTTNGYLISEQTIQSILNIHDLKDFWFQISIDSIDRTTHNSFRRFDGAFEQAWENIKLIQNCGSKLKTAIRMTVTNNTIAEMEQMVIMAMQNGVTRIGFGTVVPVGSNAEANHPLSVSEKLTFLEQIVRLNTKYQDEIFITTEDPQKFVFPNSPWSQDEFTEDTDFFGGCTAGIDGFNVSVNGNVTPCALLFEPIFNISLLQNPIDMTNVYCESPIIKGLLERIFDGKCGECKYNRICGGCRALAKYYSNNFLGSDLSCIIRP